MPLLTRSRDKECAIPRDRIFSVLILYRWGHLIKVNHDMPDDELLVEVLGNLREPTPVCLVARFIYNLRPQSRPLGNGYFITHNITLGLSKDLPNIFTQISRCSR